MVTTREAWTAPTGVTFPAGTYFVHSETCGIWDWKTPNGCCGQSNFKDLRPGEDWFDKQ